MKVTCKTYTRVDDFGPYTRITDVGSEGRYYQRCVWPDGIVTSEYHTTLQSMGWLSLNEFLKHRKGFVSTEC